MRIPEKAPVDAVLWGKFQKNPDLFIGALEDVTDPLVGDKYLHWDKLRYHPVPGPFSHEAWWFGLRFQRRSHSKSLPLQDKQGRPFSFCLIDPLQSSNQRIDSLTHGNVSMSAQITNESTRDAYVFRSLVEESITSSQIEGASTTREVAKDMIRQGRKPRDRSEQMILNNYKTMRHIKELKDEVLTKDLVFEIHRMITRDALDKPDGAGRFRRPDEDIRVADDYDVTYHVPPASNQLDGRLAAMCEFANGAAPKPYIHPAVRSMILHFQLAYDHPFVDGNGRTARALFYWSMLHHGYWLFEFISISDVILKTYGQYGNAFLLSETDNGDLTYFLDYHSKIIDKSIDNLTTYIKNKSEEISNLQAELRVMSTLNHRQRDLIGHALSHPGYEWYTYESHRMSHGVSLQTARTDILELVDRGLLKQRRQGRGYRFSAAADLESRLRKSGSVGKR